MLLRQPLSLGDVLPNCDLSSHRESPMMVTSNRLILCTACKHWERTSSSCSSCLAFPAGIPSWLLEGRANHRYPYPGDGGFRFEPADDAPNSTLSQLEELYP